MIGITNEYLASVQPRNKSIGEMVMVAYFKLDPVSGRHLKSTGKGGGVVDEVMVQETFVNEVTVAVWSHFPFPTSCDGETLATMIRMDRLCATPQVPLYRRRPIRWRKEI